MNKQTHNSIVHNRILRVLLCLVLLAAAVICVVNFRSYTQEQLYNESVSQLDEITGQLFEKMDVQLANQWMYLEKLQDSLKDAGDMSIDKMSQTLTNFYKRMTPVGKTLSVCAVDEDGYYYSGDGMQGIWPAIDRITDAQRKSFVTSDWKSNQNMMAFSLENKSGVSIEGKAVRYYILLRSMEDMAPYFQSSAFHNRNITYIMDQNGTKVFEDTSNVDLGFTGRNLIYSMQELDYPHMGSLSACLEQAREETLCCTDVLVNNTRYYMTIKRLHDYDWSMVSLVPAEEVAASTRVMTESMQRTFLIILVVMVCLAVIVFAVMLRMRKNQELLTMKTENEARLTAINHELESAQQKAAAAQAAAEAANKAKSDFLSNMSHDIRTPMNAIVGMTKLIEHEKDDPDKLDIYLDKIQISSRHLLSLINDVLDMSKIESGDVSLNTDSVSLSDEISQVENIIRPQAEEHGHDFIIRVHSLVHEYVVCDSVRLRQVIINLLSNAVKYTHNGGSISYDIEELPCSEPDSAAFRFTVADNGYGMTPEFVKHIFEPFVRAEDSTTNKVQGTGLGMAITKRIVDMMGGTITIESQLNKGSTFTVTVTFPIDHSVEHNADVSSVLLVSDDDVLTSSMRAAFSERNVGFTAVQNIPDAESMMEKQNIDVILLNGCLHEPDLSDIVKILRETSKHDILIFCCDYAKPEQEIGALKKIGADGIIPRPFFFSKFIHAIKEKRENKEQTEENTSVLSGMNFLCAEDNDLNSEILTALLDIAGAKCTIYPNGEELVKAFANVREGDYDAILMDVQMPIMNGFEATRAIRNSDNPLGKKIPIIAMTANAFSSDIQDCLDAGMDAHIAKPLEIAALEKVVKSFILPLPDEV